MIALTITGGEFKGRRIKALANEVTRYTSEKVRLACFSILKGHRDIATSHFADLCAGSGVVGIEALSRGAPFVEFYDLSRESEKAIATSLRELGVQDRARVYRRNLLISSRKLRLESEVVFIDPPFHDDIAQKFFQTFADSPNLMIKNALLMIEYRKSIPDITGFERLHRYRYGTVFLNLFRKE